MTYIKPNIEVLHTEPMFLAASGIAGDTFHDANTQKDSTVNWNGGDEYHDGDDDLEGAKIYHEHLDLWEWNY